MSIVFVVPEREPHPITGLVAHQFQCGRRYSEYYLFHPSLRGKPCEGVKIHRNKKGTAWIVKPDGQWRLLVLEGNRMSHGRWADSYKGYYVIEAICPPEGQILTNMSWSSRGGGLGATLLVMAVPRDIDPRTPIARIRVDVSWEETSTRVVLADGTTVEDIGDFEVSVSLDDLLSEKKRDLELLRGEIERTQSHLEELRKRVAELRQMELESLRVAERLHSLRRQERELEKKIKELKLTTEHEKLISQLKRLWANLRAGAPTVILREVLHEMFKQVEL